MVLVGVGYSRQGRNGLVTLKGSTRMGGISGFRLGRGVCCGFSDLTIADQHDAKISWDET